MENIEAVDIELPRDEKGKLGLIMDSKLNIKDSGINARTAGIYPGMRVVAFFGKVVRSKRDILNIERKLRRKNLEDGTNVKLTVIYDPYALTLHRASMLHKLTTPIKLSEPMQRLKNRLEMTRKNRMEMTRKRPRPRPPVPPSKREHVAVPPPPPRNRAPAMLTELHQRCLRFRCRSWRRPACTPPLGIASTICSAPWCS